MTERLPGWVDGILETDEAPDRSLVVANRTSPEPVQRLFEETFENVPVDVDEVEDPTADDDVVLLVEDGTVVARSPLQALQNAVLLVNVDLYKTGLSGVDRYEAPEVLTALDETAFTLRGFPASTKEKLLLVVMSRFIERRALETGDGRLDAAFQDLSRLDDEYGTRKIYERLGATAVDVHVYGTPGGAGSVSDGVVVHADDSEPYRRTWFVVHEPPDDAATDPAALLAVATGGNTWKATWTYDPKRVERIRRVVDATF